MVPDPSDPNRMVSRKSANQPFLAYVQWLMVALPVLNHTH